MRRWGGSAYGDGGEALRGTKYTREQLAEAVGTSSNWSELMRTLGLRVSGGRRRTLQRTVAELGLDTGHFTRRSPWSKYSDEQIARAVVSSTRLREVVAALGAKPSLGRSRTSAGASPQRVSMWATSRA